MAELTKLALAYIEEWQELEDTDRAIVLALLNDLRHKFEKVETEEAKRHRNTYAIAAYLLAALVKD